LFSYLKYLFIVGAFLLIACENSLKEVSEYSVENNSLSMSAKKIEVLYSDSGKIRLRLKAREVLRISDEKNPLIEYPKGIEVEFFNSTDEVESNLTADYAVFDEKKQFWTARNNVVAFNKREGKTLNTEELFWDVTGEKFFSEKFVKISSNEEVLCGEGFQANQNFNNWKIRKIRNSYVNLKDE